MTMLIERKDERKLSKADAIKKLEEQREKDHELVTGLFKHNEYSGGTLRFRFKKYPRDEYKQYELVDGQRYRIPRMVAYHLNTNVHYLKYSHLDKNLSDTSGMATHAAKMDRQSRFSDGTMGNNQSMYMIEKVKRCQFIPLEFSTDDLGLDSPAIIQVGTSAT